MASMCRARAACARRLSTLRKELPVISPSPHLPYLSLFLKGRGDSDVCQNQDLVGDGGGVRGRERFLSVQLPSKIMEFSFFLSLSLASFVEKNLKQKYYVLRTSAKF